MALQLQKNVSDSPILTNVVPVMKPPQSVFHSIYDDGKPNRVSSDDKEGDQIDGGGDAGYSISELTLPPLPLPSSASSFLSTKDNGLTRRLPLKLEVATFKPNRVSSDDKEGGQIDRCGDAERCVSALTLPSPPPLSALSTKGIGIVRRLQMKLDSATLKIERASDRADDTLFRVRDQVIQCKEGIVETAVAIDKQNIDESKSIKEHLLQKRLSLNLEIEKRLKHDAELKVATKLEGKLRRLEKVRVEVIDFTTEKRRALKWLVRYQKIKKDEEKTLTQIRMDSHYFTIGDDEDGVTNHDAEQLVEKVVLDESKLKQHDLALERDDEVGLEKNHADPIVDVDILTICKLLNCTQEELYDSDCSDSLRGIETMETSSVHSSTAHQNVTNLIQNIKEEIYHSDFSDESFELIVEMMENSSEDATTIQRTVTGLVQIIEEYDTRLSDIALMQSVLLAEKSALIGKDEFNTDAEGEQWCHMDKDYSFSPVDESPALKELQWSGLGGISTRVGQTIKTFRLAATKVDRYRMEQNI